MQPTMRHGQKLPGLHWGALKPEIYVHACIRAGSPVGPRLPTPLSPSLLPSSAVRASCQRHRPLGCGCACGFSYGFVSFICTADNIHEMLKIHCDIYVCVLHGTIFHTHLQSDLCGLLLFPLGTAHELLRTTFQYSSC